MIQPLSTFLASLLILGSAAHGQDANLSGGDTAETTAETVKAGIDRAKQASSTKFMKDLFLGDSSGKTRQELRRKIYEITRTAKKTGQKIWFQAADTLSSRVGVLDAVSTIIGHWSAGNLTSATGATVNEVAESLTATGSAIALGKLGLVAGTALGGPVGGVIGGGLFAAGGAMLGTLGYKVYGSDAVVKGVEGWFEPDHLQVARDSRHEYLRKNDPFYLKSDEREKAEWLLRRSLQKLLTEAEFKLPERFQVDVSALFPSKQMVDALPELGHRIKQTDKPLQLRYQRGRVTAKQRWTAFLKQQGKDPDIVEWQFDLNVDARLHGNVVQGKAEYIIQAGIRRLVFPYTHQSYTGAFFGYVQPGGMMHCVIKLEMTESLMHSSGTGLASDVEKNEYVPNPVDPMDPIEFKFDVRLPVMEQHQQPGKHEVK